MMNKFLPNFYFSLSQITQTFLQWSSRHSAKERNLGVLYEFGLGTNQSIEKANEWYSIAAENGNEDAKKALDRIAKK